MEIWNYEEVEGKKRKKKRFNVTLLVFFFV